MNVKNLVKSAAFAIHTPLRPLLQAVGIDTKRLYEIAYWRRKQRSEGKLQNDWYEQLFTTCFELPRDFYLDKRILDIGCGPRGSLEWADGALERVGLDPLVEDYRKLGIERHAMSYVAAPAERIPFPDDHFDIVTSINSLDHVEDVDAAVREIIRVLEPNGSFLLAVEIHPRPTIAEPHSLSWHFLEKFATRLEMVDEQHFEAVDGEHALIARRTFDHANPESRNGWLRTTLRKKPGPDFNEAG